MKDWSRKQYEKQKERNLGKQPIKGKTEKETKEAIYPGNKKWYTIEEAQQLERYDVQHCGTGDTRTHWVNQFCYIIWSRIT